jgi:hypothetical protein
MRMLWLRASKGRSNERDEEHCVTESRHHAHPNNDLPSPGTREQGFHLNNGRSPASLQSIGTPVMGIS